MPQYLIITEDSVGLQCVKNICSRLKTEYDPRVNIRFDCRHRSLDPIAKDERIARLLVDFLNGTVVRGISNPVVVLLIDFEKLGKQQLTCPGERASAIQTAFEAIRNELRFRIASFQVVIKNRCLENWVVADRQAVENHFSRTIKNSNDYPFIDEVNTTKLYKTYNINKTRLREIYPHLSPLRIAENSRSFRRFLRVLGHPVYMNQSKQPVKSE